MNAGIIYSELGVYRRLNIGLWGSWFGFLKRQICVYLCLSAVKYAGLAI